MVGHLNILVQKFEQIKPVAPDKVPFFNRQIVIFFLFLYKNICCRICFRGDINKTMWIPPLIWSYAIVVHVDVSKIDIAGLSGKECRP